MVTAKTVLVDYSSLSMLQGISHFVLIYLYANSNYIITIMKGYLMERKEELISELKEILNCKTRCNPSRSGLRP